MLEGAVVKGVVEGQDGSARNAGEMRDALAFEQTGEEGGSGVMHEEGRWFFHPRCRRQPEFEAKKSPLRRDARGGKVSVGLTEALSARGRHDDYDDGDEADKRDEGEAAGELHEMSKSGKADLFAVNAGAFGYAREIR